MKSTLSPTRLRFGLAARIAALAASVVIVASVLLAWIGYRAETRTALRDIDKKLQAVGTTFANLLPRDLQREALSPDVPEPRYRLILQRLTAVANDAGVYYLYTSVEKDGQIHIAMSSASKLDYETNDLPPLMEKYEQPPAELEESFRDGQTRFASYTDEFGSFRSIFVPVDVEGVRTIVGVDVQLDELHAIARGNLLQFAGYGLLIAFLIGALAAWLGHRTAAPIARLSHDVTAFADDDFSNDQESIADLHQIAHRNRTEIGTLAMAFIDMRQRLVKHFDNLTKVTAEKQEIVSRLATARRIQRSLLPDHIPKPPASTSTAGARPPRKPAGIFTTGSIFRMDGSSSASPTSRGTASARP